MSLKNNNLFPVISYLVMTAFIALIVVILKDALLPASKIESVPTTDTGTITTLTGGISEQTGVFQIEGVPFTPQAPFMNWGDLVYEEWCEEASMLMAVYWSRNKPLTGEIANVEIKQISDFEMKNLWVSHDTSLLDSAKIMQEYFSFRQYELRENITKSDIVEKLRSGNIVLVPLFGRELGNKYYTPPGPIPHMLVITGYDPEKKRIHHEWSRNQVWWVIPIRWGYTLQCDMGISDDPVGFYSPSARREEKKIDDSRGKRIGVSGGRENIRRRFYARKRDIFSNRIPISEESVPYGFLAKFRLIP